MDLNKEIKMKKKRVPLRAWMG